MRHTWLQFVIAVVLFQVAPAQPTKSSPNTLQFENGSIAKDIYTNECLGFSFAIPSGWDINSQFGGADRKAAHVPGGLMLLLLHQQKEKPPGNVIALLARDATGQTVSTKDFVSNAAHGFINADPKGRELVRDAIAVEYGGQRFFRADSKQSLANGLTVYQTDVFTRFRGYLIGAVLTAVSPEGLEDTANSLRGISFAEDQPNPKCVMGGEDPASKGIIGGVIGSVVTQPDSGRPLRVRVSQGVSQALLIKKVQPQYPDDARQSRIQGLVVLKALLDTNGDVEDLTVVSGHPLLAPAALEAVKQWKYKPYLLNGQPAKVETQITVSFQLSTH